MAKLFNRKTTKALCELQSAVFLVENPVVMVYNKLLDYAGVTADYPEFP